MAIALNAETGTFVLAGNSVKLTKFPLPKYVNSKTKTLVYAYNLSEGRGGWFADSYNPSVVLHYGEEGDTVQGLLLGGETGTIHRMIGSTDNNTDIQCQIITGATDQGDSRLLKRYGDVLLDIDTQDVDVFIQTYYDNRSVNSAGRIVTTSTREAYPVDPDDREWVTARNIGLSILFNSNDHDVKIYHWEPRWHSESAPIFAFSWSTHETTFGLQGFVYAGYLYFSYIAIADVTLTFTVDGVKATSITLPTTGGQMVKYFQRLPVMKGKLWRLHAESESQFRVAGNEAELLIKQWGANSPWMRRPLFSDTPSQSEVVE